MKDFSNNQEIKLSLNRNLINWATTFLNKYGTIVVTLILVAISIASYIVYYKNGLGLAYNDARSHLDIGRRVVEGLKPGIAQLGSVWLPLTHILMTLTIWNDFMWHSGLSGAILSMGAFIYTGLLIYLFLRRLNVGLFGRFVGVGIFVANINVLYLQSTAMTELLLLATMTAGTYYLLLWYQDNKIIHLISSAFWIMLSTLIRYDGWFLFFFAAMIIFFQTWKQKNYRTAEGMFVLFCTLGGFGIFLWLLWNQLIFKDALYFAFGPYSAYAQQNQLESAGVLATKGNFGFSLKTYWWALAYNIGFFTLLVGVLGAAVLWLDKKLKPSVRIATSALIAPFIFNVIALYLGHSVLYIQGLSGNSLFNVRYGIMMMPSIAIFIGYLIDQWLAIRTVLVGLLIFVTLFQFANGDAVTIDDARVGSSQKNVSEVSGWLQKNVPGQAGFILISAASHDAIIFSSGLPMKRFIHEGTGAYWESATTNPDRWARWIVLRTYSDDDQTYRLIKNTEGFKHYDLVQSFPFADIYQIKGEYLKDLNTEPILGKQK
ncbi:MAG: hypothetical protein PHW95_01325 [Patescibacteria group bacterium]|nr:hypothetical protein [Patescibacteria group bacterium]